MVKLKMFAPELTVLERCCTERTVDVETRVRLKIEEEVFPFRVSRFSVLGRLTHLHSRFVVARMFSPQAEQSNCAPAFASAESGGIFSLPSSLTLVMKDTTVSAYEVGAGGNDVPSPESWNSESAAKDFEADCRGSEQRLCAFVIAFTSRSCLMR